MPQRVLRLDHAARQITHHARVHVPRLVQGWIRSKPVSCAYGLSFFLKAIIATI